MNTLKVAQRVGIITFHRATNYGALLQAYALQEILRKMGCQVDIIDYRSEHVEKLHKQLSLANSRNLSDLCRFIFYSKNHNRRFQKFRKFLSRHLALSDAYFNIDELEKIVSQYDHFICGSDQIWNYKITNLDKAYFLDFVSENLKKNSYAASFGIDSIPPAYIEEYRLLLKDFSHISVREKHGNTIIHDLIGKNVDVVLDPTMLITKEEWETIVDDYKKQKDYILLYMDGISSTMNRFVESLSQKTGCKIVYISYSLIRRINAIYEKCIGPSEFLGLFKHARYVVTNSFHGTAFSINFNKDFFIEMLPESQGVNSRLENILDVFDLRRRQIISGNIQYADEPIDYSIVNEKLRIERQKSLNFLHQIILSYE